MKAEKKPRKTVRPTTVVTSLSPGAHALASIGKETEEKVVEFLSLVEAENLFDRIDHEELRKLANAFEDTRWSDVEAAKVVETYGRMLATGRRIDNTSLQRWIRSHPNDAQAVIDCMSVDPPAEITLTRVLSRAGSQKLVFLATWMLTQREVVLKKLTGPPDVARAIIAREAQSHPLSMVHDNIIETHVLRNADGEIFLVEERLPCVLSDNWESRGLSEAANLLYDIANALKYLHTELDLVHGDVKPDNIGRRGSEYVLLDFGICRRSQAFTPEITPTGSLRTRAPELLQEPGYREPQKADVWALGATVYNALVHRFPLFELGERPPRVSTPEERRRFEIVLQERVERDWDRLVDISRIDEPLRGVLSRALEQDPAKRCSAADLMIIAETDLSAFLRRPSSIGPFSPLDELQQINDYLPRDEILKLMPATQKQLMQTKLKGLLTSHGLTNEQKEHINQLLHLVS